MSRFYVDTSAYLCLLLGEEGHVELRRELGGGHLLSSALLLLEAERNLVRLARQGILGSAELQTCLDRLHHDVEQFLLRDLNVDLCVRPRMPVVSTPRSLDLVHLQTARWFHQQEPLVRFVTLDATQEIAARELGLPV